MTSMIKSFFSYFIGKKVEVFQSEIYGPLEVWKQATNYHVHSEENDQLVFLQDKLMQKVNNELKPMIKPLQKILVLGYGLGKFLQDIPSEILDSLEIHGVEEDQTLFELAKKYFPWENKKSISVFNSNALSFLSNSNKSYDHLIFCLEKNGDIPNELSQVKNLSNYVKDHLNTNGTLSILLTKDTESTLFRNTFMYDYLKTLSENCHLVNLNSNYQLLTFTKAYCEVKTEDKAHPKSMRMAAFL